MNKEFQKWIAAMNELFTLPTMTGLSESDAVRNALKLVPSHWDARWKAHGRDSVLQLGRIHKNTPN